MFHPRRQSLWQLGALVVFAVATSPLAAADAEPLAIGNHAQVLVDDHVIESMTGLVRRIQPFAKHPANPVLKPDMPWEEGSAVPISAFYDTEQKLYRLWYRPGIGKFNLGYATSPDCISWTKPSLGQVDYKGSRENSYLAIKTGPAWGGIIKDTSEPDTSRRYKFISYNRATESNGLYLHVSPDGLAWKPHSDKPLLEGLADCHTLMGWDANINRYVAYVRPDKVIRTIARTTSEDLITWTPWQVVLEPDDDDPLGTQFYGMTVYPDRGVYYGLLWVYHPNSLTLDVQLTFSRDGIQWQRAGRRHPILSWGLPNQFDSHVVLALQPMLVENELKVLYYAQNRPHPIVYANEAVPAIKVVPPRTEQTWLAGRQGFTGLATCGRDRFVSIDGSSKPASLVTKPFKLEGRALVVNADCSRGELRTEVLDEAGQAIPGFAIGYSTSTRGDSQQHAITFRGAKDTWKDLSSLTGRTIKLRFQLQSAKLYSFQVLP
jgi:hypothetical protein